MVNITKPADVDIIYITIQMIFFKFVYFYFKPLILQLIQEKIILLVLTVCLQCVYNDNLTFKFLHCTLISFSCMVPFFIRPIKFLNKYFKVSFPPKVMVTQ